MERPKKAPVLVVTVEQRSDEEGVRSLWLTVDETTDVYADGWASRRVVEKRITLNA